MAADAINKMFDDVAKRACIICKMSLAEIVPKDLIETKLGYACAECLDDPEVLFVTLPCMERAH